MTPRHGKRAVSAICYIGCLALAIHATMNPQMGLPIVLLGLLGVVLSVLGFLSA